MMRKYSLIAVTLLLFSYAQAQDEVEAMAAAEPGLVLGVTGGLYLSGDATANYYNGSGFNNIDLVIFNSYNYPRIKDEVIHDFTMGEYPMDMKYNLSAYLGGFVGYRMASGLTPYMEVAFTNLKLESTFTLILDDPSTGTSEDDIEVANITGEEKRVDFNLGALYYFKGDRLLPYAEAGLNANFVKLEDNHIYIRNWHQTIVRQTNPRTNQGGFGYGVFAGLGVQYRMNDTNSFLLGFKADYKSINLVEEEEKPTLDLHFIPYLRFMFG